nr:MULTISPECIES: YfbU family protein [unclassified Pantoea]
MLCDIHRALKIRDSVDPSFIEDALLTENTWAIGFRYQSLNDGNGMPRHVTFVGDVADMYSILQYTYNNFDESEKAEIASSVPNFKGESSLVFPGFDGNNETEYLSAADMFKRMERFEDIDITKNSHAPYVATYKRMLDVFIPARNDDWTHDAGISKDSFVAVLNARIHPSNRGV